MDTPITTSTSEDLFLIPGTTVSVTPKRPIGGGSHDPAILLGNDVEDLDGQPLPLFDVRSAYDTYDGRNTASDPDVYIVSLPRPVELNTLRMTMGIPYRDGGWWTSFRIEYRRGDRWEPVRSPTSHPEYPSHDSPVDRRPYTPYVITFDDIRTDGVRVVGRPGGIAQFTSIARLSGYFLDLTRWNPLDEKAYPFPLTYSLISPATVWDLSENLAKATGLDVMCSLLEYYLDAERYALFWNRLSPAYKGEPPLWFLAGETMGWERRNTLEPTAITPIGGDERIVVRRFFNGVLADASVALFADGIPLGHLVTSEVILSECDDEKHHRDLATMVGIPWKQYVKAADRMMRMSATQLEGIAGLMHTIGQLLVDHAHRNIVLSRRLDRHLGDGGSQSRPSKNVRRAIDWMESHLEDGISVDDVAAAVSLTHQHFSTVFKQEVGTTPVEFLTDLKIRRAKELLQIPAMSVLDTAVALGFSQEYFSRLFKRRTGISPDRYKKSTPHHVSETGPPFLPPR